MSKYERNSIVNDKKEGESADKSNNTDSIRRIIEDEDKSNLTETKEPSIKEEKKSKSKENKDLSESNPRKSKKIVDVGSKSMDIVSSGIKAEKASVSLNLESKVSVSSEPNIGKSVNKSDSNQKIQGENKTKELSKKKTFLSADQTGINPPIDDQDQSNFQKNKKSSNLSDQIDFKVKSNDHSKSVIKENNFISDIQEEGNVSSLNDLPNLKKSIEQINPINATNDLTISESIKINVNQDHNLESSGGDDVSENDLHEMGELEVNNGISEECSFCNVLKFGSVINCQNCIGILDDSMFKESIFVPIGMNVDDVKIELIENGYIITGGDETLDNKTDTSCEISHSLKIHRTFSRNIENVKVKKSNNKIRVLGYFGTGNEENTLKSDVDICKRRKSFEK